MLKSLEFEVRVPSEDRDKTICTVCYKRGEE